MPLIYCRNLSLGYEGRTIVSGLDFEVNQGDYLAVIGENGSGKSTLMKVVLGIEKPESGTIIYGDGLKKNEIGFLPQQPEILNGFNEKVAKVVLSGCLNRHRYGVFFTKKDRQDAADNMRRLGITEIQNRNFRELSGGQKQRVMLARALCATKKLLVLDEPAAGLDSIVTRDFYDIIAGLNREEKITVVMITGDRSTALRYSSHILYINHEKPFFGTKNEYLTFISGISKTTT